MSVSSIIGHNNSGCPISFTVCNGWLIFAVGLVFAAGSAFIMSPLDKALINRYPLDVCEFVLALKAVLGGQALNIDQLTPIGPLFFFPMVAGFKLFGSAVAGIHFSVLFEALLGCALCALAAHRRLSVINGVLIVLVYVIVCLQPCNLGETAASIAMEYNKYCFSALLLYFVVLCLPKGKGYTDAFVLCLLFYVMLMTKMSYAVVAVVAAVMSAGLRQGRDKAVPFLAILLGLAFAMLTPHSGDYFKDFVFSGLQSGKTKLNYEEICALFLKNNLPFAFAFVIYLICGKNSSRRASEYILAAAITLGGSFAALTQNAQWRLMPSAIACFVIYFEWSRAFICGLPIDIDASQRKHSAAIFSSKMMIMFIFYGLMVLFVGSSGIVAYAAAIRRPSAGNIEAQLGQFTSGILYPDYLSSGQEISLAEFSKMAHRKIQDVYIDAPAFWFASLKEAEKLATTIHLVSGSVFTFDAVNGVALLDGFMPSAPWHLWTQAKFKLLPADDVFRAADAVFIPRYPAHRDVYVQLEKKYGAYVAGHYAVAARSDMWMICQKKDVGSTTLKREPCEVPAMREDWPKSGQKTSSIPQGYPYD
ncbi:MAG: hypothetical protein PHW76_03695 [Alphaproteobacteria bacterium]|nr:hypothetical protein [Alphaproteobacteria bacterium]